MVREREAKAPAASKGDLVGVSFSLWPVSTQIGAGVSTTLTPPLLSNLPEFMSTKLVGTEHSKRRERRDERERRRRRRGEYDDEEYDEDDDEDDDEAPTVQLLRLVVSKKRRRTSRGNPQSWQ